MRNFGLIGFPLTHSFSKKYFTDKFKDLGISSENTYHLWEIEQIEMLEKIIAETENLVGINVTIPHKQNVIPFLNEIDPAAKRIGAVNVIKVLPNNKLKGYNSDYYGFKKSLTEFLGGKNDLKALVLGNGGAAKAICVALEDLEISFKLVSRVKSDYTINYRIANELLNSHKLIINTTPLGTYPNIKSFPDLDYEMFGQGHFCFDLVYNPGETQFLIQCKNNGAATKNGYDMLVYQAEKSWEIWNDK